MEDFAAVAAWVRLNREHLGWSTAELAEHARRYAREKGDSIKLTQQSISGLENGRLKKEPFWLRYVRSAIEQQGEIERRHDVVSLSAADHARELDQVLLPRLDVGFSMGGGSVLEDFPDVARMPFPRAWLRPLMRGNFNDLFIASGEGDSMIPTLLDGDDVIIDTAQREIDRQDRIWAVRYGDLGMIKRVRRLPGGVFQLNSDNPAVTPIVANDQEMEVVGRVVWVGRRI